MIKYVKTLQITCVMLFAIGCTDSYVKDLNTSPNSPSEVLNSNLLTAAEVALFGNVTGEIARTSSIWMQSQAGLGSQSLDEHAMYKLFEGDNVNEWGSIYTDWMETSENLIIQAGNENPYYKGMGIVLKAWAGCFTSDVWGDVPFSEATLGINNLHPNYDSQSGVYSASQQMWSDAISLFEKPVTDNAELPEGDDLVFNGDITKWIKMTWMLKARYANRISNKSSYNADNVILFLNNANLSGTEDNAYAKFGDKANNANQWYAFYQQRTGYMGMGEYLIEKMSANKDPRLSYYSDTTSIGEYLGSPVDTRNVIDTASIIGSYLNASSNSVPLITFEECKFIEAEALLTSNATESAKAFNEAVLASVKRITGIEADSTFKADHASKEAADMSLEVIINGKYISSFSQVEVWNDWRRTEYPTIIKNPDPKANKKGIPQRFPTCIDERLNNQNAILISDNYQKVWFAK